MPIADCLNILHDTAKGVRAAEAEAAGALNEDNIDGYKRAMHKKAMLLVDLPDELEDACEGVDPKAAKAILAGARDFARRAGMALDLDSTFFMANLLYPEDYADGDPNELELFIARFG